MNCWFCSVREAEEKHVYGIDMHGDVDAQNTGVQTNIAQSVRHIDRPRCADCHSKHRIAKMAKLMSFVLLVLLLGAAVFGIFNWAAPLVVGVWGGLSSGLVIAMLLCASMVQKGIHTLRGCRLEHPLVKELLEKCYRFGLRPKAVMPKSDQPCKQSGDEDI